MNRVLIIRAEALEVPSYLFQFPQPPPPSLFYPNPKPKKVVNQKEERRFGKIMH